MKCKGGDICILTDTHSSTACENQWKEEWGNDIYFSHKNSKSRGVTVLMNTKKEVKVHDVISDDKDGNYLILDISLGDKRITLVGLYGPNDDEPNFYGKIYEIALKIGNPGMVWVGDWNVVLNYDLDTFGYLHRNNVKAHEKVIEIMEKLSLKDIWRDDNPDVRRYTWHSDSAPHKFARLDYFLVSDFLCPTFVESKIHSSYRSDHTMITLEINTEQSKKGRGLWKFNSSLLKEIEYSRMVKKTIDETVQVYRVDKDLSCYDI